MRMWMTNPKIMCRKHLLGEHVECHMFVGTILKNKNLQGYFDNGLLIVSKLKQRHDALAEEMVLRGYTHKSPLPDFEYYGWDGIINFRESKDELLRRCPICSKLNQDLKGGNEMK